MGQPKQLLEVAGQPMLLAVLEPLIACELVASVFVVTNSLVASSLDIAETDASVVLNDDPDAEMIDSVRQGVTELQRRHELTPDDGVLICPGDQPGLTTDDITRCCQVYLQSPTKITIASHGDKRGHPMIFPASMIPLVMSNACDAGLRALPEAQAERVVTATCAGPAVLRNVNTPDDYRRLG